MMITTTRRSAAPHTNHTRSHRTARSLVAATALLAAPVLAGVLGFSAPAYAAPATASLNLTDGTAIGNLNPGSQWVVNGTGLAPSRSDVQVWIMKASTWTTLEYQSGQSTTAPYYSTNCTATCYFLPGGRMTARGSTVAWGTPDGFHGTNVLHWLECATTYQAVSYDPVDGWVYSNLLTEPACPPPFKG